MYYTMCAMAKPRTPTPEELAQQGPGGSKRVMSIRLNEPDFELLLSLAERAGIGHATLARRIVESWLRDQAPRSGRRAP